MRQILFVVLIISICGKQSAMAQMSTQWQKENDWGNRYEGTFTQRINSRTMRLTSLIGYFEGYSFGKGIQLNVRFFSPSGGKYLLTSQEKLPSQLYIMIAKNQSATTGKNTFLNWPVDDVLRDLQIMPWNLGILVRLGEKGSREFTPAFVYHNTCPAETEKYTAHFLVGSPISDVRYQIYQGRNQTSGTPIKSFRTSNKIGGSVFKLIVRSEWISEGWVTVEINGTDDNAQARFSYSFSFYHKT